MFVLDLQMPDLADEAGFMAMVDEFRAAGEGRYVDDELLTRYGFRGYVASLARAARGESRGPVGWSAYWARDAATRALVGMCSIRHELTPWLADHGGHIAYRVRPSMRRRGAGTAILAQALRLAREHGVQRALLVCTPDNLASQGVLRRHGAVFEREITVEGIVLNRYWVATGS